MDKSEHAMPSRKGISLTLDQFKTLSAEAESISKCMEELQSRPKAEASGAAAGGAGGGAVAAAPKPAAGKAAGDEDAGEGLAGSELTVPLSEKRVARVYTFKGMVLVDLREMWTDAAGTQKPTKKGACTALTLASNPKRLGAHGRHSPRAATASATCCHSFRSLLHDSFSLLASDCCCGSSDDAGISLRLDQFQKLVAGSASIIAAMEGVKGSAATSSSSSSSAGAGSAAVTSSKGGAKAARTSRDEVDYGEPEPE